MATSLLSVTSATPAQACFSPAPPSTSGNVKIRECSSPISHGVEGLGLMASGLQSQMSASIHEGRHRQLKESGHLGARRHALQQSPTTHPLSCRPESPGCEVGRLGTLEFHDLAQCEIRAL